MKLKLHFIYQYNIEIILYNISSSVPRDVKIEIIYILVSKILY